MEEARRVGPGEKLELALRQRRQFWMDTCCEVREMQSPSRQVMELYRRHGCRLYAPDARQIQHVLDALDSALPGWERGHPELFYQTLELNFGELVRVRSSLGAE